MACAFPLTIKNPNFIDSRNKNFTPKWYNSKEYLEVPCGRCLNCRVDKRNSLEDLCNYEYKKRGYGTFLTLTYDDYHIIDKYRITEDGLLTATLQKKDAQDFFKRLRRFIEYHNLYSNDIQKDFKYLCVGEYGDSNNSSRGLSRPHLHILIFGIDFAKMRSLAKYCWKGGFIDSRPILKGGIRYVLKYLDKQLYGEDRKIKYDNNGLEPPFMCHSQSLGTGLYTDNLEFIKNNNFCYKSKHNVLRPIPAYYKNKFLGRTVPDLNIIRDKMAQDCIPLQKNQNRYNLHQINEYRKNQTHIRYENLVNLARRDNVPVPIVTNLDFNFDDMSLVNQALDINTYGDSPEGVPF